MYKSWTLLIKFISKYFIIFELIVHGIVLFIPFLDNSLQYVEMRPLKVEKPFLLFGSGMCEE